MRQLEQIIFTHLGSLVANRVHPVVVPQTATYPCIRYANVTGSPESSLCGSSGLMRSNVQFDLFAPDFSTLLGLRNAFVERMQTFPLACILTFETDGFEPDDKLFRRTFQFSIAEQEGP